MRPLSSYLNYITLWKVIIFASVANILVLLVELSNWKQATILDKKGNVASIPDTTSKYFVKEYVEPLKESKPGSFYEVLIWTPYFGQRSGYQYDTAKLDCKVPVQCKSTEDRSSITRADVILLHWWDIRPWDLPPAREPASFQKWAFMNIESASETRWLSYLLNLVIPEIDITITYRQDSDVEKTYGELVPRSPEEQYFEEIILNETSEEEFKQKHHAVALISHCHTHANREGYIQELKKYAKVEVFGNCGKPAIFCFPTENRETCYSRLGQRYKFFLSFENSICADYITEKFFVVLQTHGMIPVVFGGGNYERIAPEGSYIDALDYLSPKHLAQYMDTVANNFTLFQSYFQWKPKWKVLTFTDQWFCKLCNKIHEGKREMVYYQNRERKNDLHKWWFEDSNCRKWEG